MIRGVVGLDARSKFERLTWEPLQRCLLWGTVKSTDMRSNIQHFGKEMFSRNTVYITGLPCGRTGDGVTIRSARRLHTCSERVPSHSRGVFINIWEPKFRVACADETQGQDTGETQVRVGLK